MIALAILASLAGLSALLWYFYRLGEKSQKRREIQAQIDEIEGVLRGEVDEIPDNFYKSLNPNYDPTVEERLAQAEFEAQEKTNYSIEPDS